MATAREESNPYGGGAGGKFRKKPYRRPQSTPYDRPPPAIRNPTIVPGADGNGWLRKIMDPAQKLLATTARRFYTSVFRKRLTQPPPPPPQPPEPVQEAGDKIAAVTSLDIPKEQEVAFNGHQKPNPGGSSIDLEDILKQKTFTRSEIEHLTALLHARVLDNLVEVEEKTPEVIPSRSSLFSEWKEEMASLPLKDNGSGSGLVPYKAVLDEDVASPAELAKAYMGSRPSKVSPSLLALRSQAPVEESTVRSSLVHSSRSPILSLVPSSSGHVGVRENGYTTPRSRGRSAIYSMARTPYSRVHGTSALKSTGTLADGYDGLSSTVGASDHNRIPGSTKTLRRSSSIFENDIGSGPMRRIRQKPNLSYRKNWMMSTFEAGEPSSSALKTLPVSERKVSFAEHSNVAPVSSKSSEMASKILQQLDTIVSPPKERSSELKLAVARDKAPAKLSPSKLQGQALKSLEHIDSSKFLEFVRDNNNPNEAVATFLHGSGETRKEKQDKIEINGSLSIFSASEKLSPSISGLENAVAKKDAVPVGNTGDAKLMRAHAPVEKKRAFKMSAHEDFFDLEDDGYPNGLSSSLIEVREKQDTGTVKHRTSAARDSIISEKHQLVGEDERSTNLFPKTTVSQDFNGKQVVAQNSVTSVPPAGTSSLPDVLPIQSRYEPDKAAMLKVADAAAPLFSSGVKVSPMKDQSVPTPVFGFASNNEFPTSSADKAHQFKFGMSSSGELSSQKAPPNSNAQSLSSGTSVAGELLFYAAMIPEFDETEDKKTSKDGVLSVVPDGGTVTSVSTTSSATFTFGIKSTSSSNGSTVSSAIPVDSKTVVSEKPFSIPSIPVTFSGNNSSSTKLSSITATTSTLPNFTFGSSPSSSASLVTSSTAVASENSQLKPDMRFGNVTSSPFVAANSTSGSSTFGFGATTAPSNSSDQKEGSAIVGAANGPALVSQSTIVGTGLTPFSQSVTVQLGSSSSSSGPSTTAAAPTSSSLFGSSSAAKLFSSGTSLGSGMVPSSENSSLSPSTSSLFGQATTTPAFGSSLTTQSPSTGLSFGSSSSSSSSFVFGCAPGSSAASSSSSIFGLSGTSPIFGSTGSSSTSTMTSVFGSTGALPASSVFGSTGASSASTAASVFGSSSTASASTAPSLFGSISTSSASTVSSIFGSNKASSTPSPVFGSMSASSGPMFSFGAASANPSSGPTFSFNSAAATPSPAPSPSPVFGISSSSPFTFGSPAPASNNHNTDQMSMEDSMAEDTVQTNNNTATPPAPVFGQQQPVSPAAGFVFGSSPAPGANPFQFGAPQNLSTPQNPSPFQASGSLDFNAGGGSFSLGTSGGDKAGRKIIRVNRNKQRRK